ELASMTGDIAVNASPAAGQAPLLELQFGEVLTKTGMRPVDQNAMLVMAFLPRCKHTQFQPQANVWQEEDEEAMTYFWHADEGRYIGVRRVLISKLQEERDVMDAIAETAELALLWFAQNRGSK